MTPTESIYLNLQSAYQHFNQSLFEGKLPEIIFTTQRNKGVMGYFSKERWKNKDGEHCHEIAINPAYINQSTTLEVLQTLVHEMCHEYQYLYGTPSRGGYHNKQFANMMEERGLIPSSTGKKGGAKTGQRMNDYPQKDGLFIREAIKLIDSGKFALNWIDRAALIKNEGERIDLSELTENELSEDLVSVLTEIIDNDTNNNIPPPPQPIKTCYHCVTCNFSLWGKKNLNIICGDCDTTLILKKQNH